MNGLEGLHILLVEDDEMLGEVLCEELQMYGGLVERAESGEAAIPLILSKKFDFILSDMRMPNGDGRFLAKEVKKLDSKNKPYFFIYSGFNDITDIEAIELEIRHLFSKPIKVEEMIDKVLQYLKNK